MTTIVDTDSDSDVKEGYAIVYFADNGFEIFTSIIDDIKTEIVLTTYPTLMGMMQNQDIQGLATTKITNETFLFAFALNVKNLDARDFRLKRKTITIINFIVSKEKHRYLMLHFDEFEKFLEDYFQPIIFLFDLYALDFAKIIPQFIERQKVVEKVKRKKNEEIREHSIASEFNRWLSEVKTDDYIKEK